MRENTCKKHCDILCLPSQQNLHEFVTNFMHVRNIKEIAKKVVMFSELVIYNI
jgi:hypothetical protein